MLGAIRRAVRRAVRRVRTFTGIWQVCDGFGHDDREFNRALDLVQPELQKCPVQDVLFDVPIADYAGSQLESVSDVSLGVCVGIAVVAREGVRLTQFPIPVLGHYRW